MKPGANAEASLHRKCPDAETRKKLVMMNNQSVGNDRHGCGLLRIHSQRLKELE